MGDIPIVPISGSLRLSISVNLVPRTKEVFRISAALHACEELTSQIALICLTPFEPTRLPCLLVPSLPPHDAMFNPHRQALEVQCPKRARCARKGFLPPIFVGQVSDFMSRQRSQGNVIGPAQFRNVFEAQEACRHATKAGCPACTQADSNMDQEDDIEIEANPLLCKSVDALDHGPQMVSRGQHHRNTL